MEQSQPSQRPLLIKQSYPHPENTTGNRGSSRRVLTKDDAEQRSRIVRTSAVLSSIMEKTRNDDKRQGDTVTQAAIGGGSSPHVRPKSFVYTMLNPRSKSWPAVSFKWFITLVIIADLIAFVVSTEPDLDVHQKHVCYVWEGVTSTIFLIEYMTRLMVVTEARKYSEQGPIVGRISYALTWPALIDFLATFPFFIELMTGLSLPTLTYLRAFRLLRILKTSGFAEATNAVYRVIYYNRQILHVAMLICIGLVVFTAVLMYYLRPKDPNHSQDFQSLSRTMYLSTLMLTGQGGPDGEIPWYTKGVVLMTGVFSIGMFAIPASMLTWGFEAEAERLANLAYARERKPRSPVEGDNWSFSSDDYSTDEEYRKIIAGADDVGDSDEDAAAKKAFLLADIDKSGSISLTEYLAMSREQAAISKTAESSSGLASNDVSVRLTSLEQRVEENSKKT